MSPQPSVSVIICAYTMDRWTQLQQAVRSVLDQDPGPLEVVLVIDHCTDLEGRARADLTPLGVSVVSNGRKRGLSGARNTGCEVARGDVVVFLDDDAEAEAGWLAAHVAHYRDERVMGVGGQVTPRWESGEPRWFPREFGWVVGCSYVGQPTTTATIRNPIGANMSFRRDVIRAAGGFAETLGRVGSVPTGCEETELAIRAARVFPQGRVVHEPAAVVHHHVPEVRAQWRYFRRRCWSEGRSKAWVSRLADPREALASERSYVLRTLPAGVRRNLVTAVRDTETGAAAQTAVIVAGLAITTVGYLSVRMKKNPSDPGKGEDMSAHVTETAGRDWLDFDVHGRLGIRVQESSPAAAQLRTMLACFATDRTVPADIVVSDQFEAVGPTSDLENEMRYTDDSVEMVQEKVQFVRDGSSYRVHGHGELLTALVPVLDRAMVERGAAMIHAATVGPTADGVEGYIRRRLEERSEGRWRRDPEISEAVEKLTGQGKPKVAHAMGG
jgi:GT2 family glycosyltransferase